MTQATTNWFRKCGWGVLTHWLPRDPGFSVDEPRFCDELLIGYTKQINLNGGVVTWDVPIGEDGHLQEAFVRQLSVLSEESQNWTMGNASRRIQATLGSALDPRLA